MRSTTIYFCYTALDSYETIQFSCEPVGPWTFPGCEAVAVVHTDSSREGLDPPDLQLMLLPGGFSSDGGVHLRKAVGVLDKVTTERMSEYHKNTNKIGLLILMNNKEVIKGYQRGQKHKYNSWDDGGK